jgi:hypothetical protein
VAEVGHHLLEGMTVVEDHLLVCLHLLDFLLLGVVGFEVVVVAEGSRAVVVVGVADCHLVPKRDYLHCRSVQHLLLLLLLLPKSPFLSPFPWDKSRKSLSTMVSG